MRARSASSVAEGPPDTADLLVRDDLGHARDAVHDDPLDSRLERHGRDRAGSAGADQGDVHDAVLIDPVVDDVAAVALQAMGDGAGAARIAHRACATGGEPADAQLIVGMAAMSRGEIERALGAFDRASALAPDRAMFRMLRSGILVQLRRYDDAYEALLALYNRQAPVDVAVLAEMKKRRPNLDGVIIGKAIYEGQISLGQLFPAGRAENI